MSTVILCSAVLLFSTKGSTVSVTTVDSLLKANSTPQRQIRTRKDLGGLAVALSGISDPTEIVASISSLLGAVAKEKAGNSLELVLENSFQRKLKSELIASIDVAIKEKSKNIVPVNLVASEFEKRLRVASTRVGVGGFSPSQAATEYSLTLSAVLLPKIIIALGKERLADMDVAKFTCFSTSPNGSQIRFPTDIAPTLAEANDLILQLARLGLPDTSNEVLKPYLMWISPETAIKDANLLVWRSTNRIGFKLEIFSSTGKLMSLAYDQLDLAPPKTVAADNHDFVVIDANTRALALIAQGRSIPESKSVVAHVRSESRSIDWISDSLIKPYFQLLDKQHQHWIMFVTDRAIESAFRTIAGSERLDSKDLSSWLSSSGYAKHEISVSGNKVIVYRPALPVEDLLRVEANRNALASAIQRHLDGKAAPTTMLEAMPVQPLAANLYFGNTVIRYYINIAKAISDDCTIPTLGNASNLSWGALAVAIKSTPGVTRVPPIEAYGSVMAWLASGSGPKSLSVNCTAFESAGSRIGLSELDQNVEYDVSRLETQVLRWKQEGAFDGDDARTGIPAVQILSFFRSRSGLSKEEVIQFFESLTFEVINQIIVSIKIRKKGKWERRAEVPIRNQSLGVFNGFSRLPVEIRDSIIRGSD